MPVKKKAAKVISKPIAEPESTQDKQDYPQSQHELQQENLPLSIRPANPIVQKHHNLELTQKVASLLSQEAPPAVTTHPIPFQPITNHTLPNLPSHSFIPSDFSAQISSLTDQRVKILDEKLKLYQSQITQLRNELEAKNQIVEEFHKFQQSEAEKVVEKYKSTAEARFTANDQLIKAQAAELKENRTIIKELNAKISRIYSGEEERHRIKLESENQELLRLNEQMKANVDNQRRKRKEAERELGRANAAAQEAVKDQLNEANNEVQTLKKMLEAETTNSKALISQLNQLRANNNNSTTSSNSQRNNNHASNSSNVSLTHLNEVIEDLKIRASIVGDFTGFQIINSSVDGKGPIYDCIVTDLVQRKFALSFKIQFHIDKTCSYFPSLDPERDESTIKVLPDFLRSFIRFQKEATGHVFWKLFQSFNL